jgi:septal ring factor EnvC (AmiA/AmiB activator)
MSISKDIIETEMRTKGGSKVRSQMADVSKEIRRLSGENERLKVSKAKLEAQGKKNTKEWKQLNDQIKHNNKEITRQKGKYKELNSQLDITEKSATELRKESRRLRRELNGVSKSVEPKRWKRLNAELERTEKQYRKVRAGTRRTSKLMSGLKDALPIVGIGALIAGVGRLIGKWAQWQTQLEKTRHQIRQLTDAAGSQLDSLTAKTQAVAKTFNKDLKQVSESANALAKQMNISYGRAMDLIQEGFAAGADSSGEFLDMLREYPAQLNEVGLNAEQAIAIMTQQVKEGVFSDKGVDAIKEAGIALREMTQPTQDAIEAMGLTVDQVQQVIGEEGLIGGIKLVSQQLNQLEADSPAVGMALADIFKGPGEDAGLEYLKTLKDIDTNMNEVIDDTDQYAKAQQDLVEANEKVSESLNAIFGKDSWWTRVKVTWKNFWANTLDQMRQFNVWLNQVKKSVGLNYKDYSEFQDVIMNTVPVLRELSDEVRKHGAETEKGKEALADLQQKLIETYGEEGLEIARNFSKEQYDLAQERIKQRRKEAEENENADNKTKKSFKELNESMERAYQERTLDLKQQLAAQKISQEQFHDEMQVEELTYLAAKKGLYERFGKDTVELSQKIADKQIEMNERMKNLTLEQGQQLKEQLQKDLETTDQWMQGWMDKQNQNLLQKTTEHRQRINDMLNQSYLESLWDLKKALNQKEITQEEYNKAVEERSKAEARSWAMSGAAAVENAETVAGAAENVLNSIRKQIKAYLMEALASTVANALASVPFPANIALATTAAAAASALFDRLIPKADFTQDTNAGQPKVSQRASGNLDVVGEDDGRLYRNVPYTGSLRGVGIANRGKPALINEHGGELIVDTKTTDNIRTNAPELIDMLKSYQVPQRAEGKVPESNGNFQQSIDEMNRNIAMMNRNQQILADRLKNLKATISAEQAKEELEEFNDFENDVGY